jgi:nucleotide-binding universal stress UspA family protein
MTDTVGRRGSLMKVLVAVDGSRDSQAAVRFLQKLRLRVRTELLILHVYESWSEPAVLSSSGRSPQLLQRLAALREVTADKARVLVGGVQRQVGGRGLRVRTLLAEGLAAPEILEALDRHRVDLAVMGTRGLSGVQRFLLGSTSEQVLTHGRCSVLVVRGQPRRVDPARARGMRVLLASDGSPHANAAVDLLAKLGLPRSAVVTLLHVVETHDYLTSRLLATGRSDLRRLAEEVIQGRKQAGAGMLEKARRVFKRRSLTADTLVAEGPPAEAILRTAERLRADLVVMGSRGLTGMKRLLLGSVSHKVTRHSPCSVLVVRKNSR